MKRKVEKNDTVKAQELIESCKLIDRKEEITPWDYSYLKSFTSSPQKIQETYLLKSNDGTVYEVTITSLGSIRLDYQKSSFIKKLEPPKK